MDRIQMHYESLKNYNEEFGIVNLKRDNKNLKIYFAPNLDIYFTLDNYQDNPSFIVGKDNALIYQAFFKLYHDIINCDIYKTSEQEIINQAEMFDEDYHEALRDAKYLREKRTEALREKLKYNNLIKDGEIVWMSDDYPIILPSEYSNMTKYEIIKPDIELETEVAPSFKIEKRENVFIITFDKGNIKDFFTMGRNIKVRIRMSGSHYEPFNIAFMNLYISLKEIALRDGEQMDIDEYLIFKKVDEGEDLRRILLKK